MITEEQLAELHSKLIYGDYNKIAKETGYMKPFISNVLNGKLPITDNNYAIIKSALRLIGKRTEMIRKDFGNE